MGGGYPDFRGSFLFIFVWISQFGDTFLRILDDQRDFVWVTHPSLSRVSSHSVNFKTFLCKILNTVNALHFVLKVLQRTVLVKEIPADNSGQNPTYAF